MKKPGIYESIYGNAVEVIDWNLKTAWDLDMREEIPIEFVTDNFIDEIER